MKLFRAIALLVAILGAVALAAPAGAAQPNWPPVLVIATASPGGTYHAYGAGLAQLLTRVLNLPVAEQTTEGPRENIQLIESGKAQIGFVTMGVALQAWNGAGDWTNGKQFREIRALFPMYDTPFHFVVPKDSPIRTFGNLAGHRVGVGPAGGTAGTYVPRFFETLNVAAVPVYGTWDELAAQLRAGSLDGLAIAGGVPFPAVAGLEAESRIRSVQLSQEEILQLRLAMPELSESVIPAGSYPTFMTGYRTVGLYNFAVVDKDMPIDLAYQIVDAVFSSRDEMISIHPAAVATIPANFIYNTFLPYHPGALRYFGNVAAKGISRAD